MKNQFTKTYTPKDAERIKELIRQNYTYKQIADIMKVSRSAIAGKIHRMKLPTITDKPDYKRLSDTFQKLKVSETLSG